MGPGVGVGVEMKELLLPKIGPGVGEGVGVAKLPIVVNMLPKNEPVNCNKCLIIKKHFLGSSYQFLRK